MVGQTFIVPRRLAHWGVSCAVCCGLALLGGIGFSDDQTESKTTPETNAAQLADIVTFSKSAEGDATEDAGERKALEAAIQEFASAFNKHDAAALTALYTSNGELTDQGGRVIRGAKAIEAAFTKLFADQPEIGIKLHVESLRFLGSGIALEEGVSVMGTSSKDAPPTSHEDRFTVTHVKQDGKWLIAAARDWAPAPLTGEQQLKQLEWLIGEWVDENSDTLVHTNYRWSEDKRYILSKYQVQRAGQEAIEGHQRIGWDPHKQQLHSWTFDNAGKFSEGLWSRAGDVWIQKLTGVTPDGKVRSATNILTRLGPDHAMFQSRDRVIGSQAQPDLSPVPIVRKPPQPSLPKGTPQTAKQPDTKSDAK